MYPALLFYLLAAHALMDFALQSNSMAGCKCRCSSDPLARQVPWYYWLTAHAVLHGAAAGAVVGWFGFGWNAVVLVALAETAVHWVVDFGKCEGWYGLATDQAVHIGCKGAWWGLLAGGVFPL